jgi:hypothetical protein
MWYRLRQFFAALTARLSQDDRAVVARALSPAERCLFERMPRYDQRHCLDVYNTLRAAGHDDAVLLKAALLHDCGKVGDDGRPIPLIYYGLFVVLKRLLPGIYDLAERGGRRPERWFAGPLRPFAIHAAHEQRAARMAEAAGASPELAAILRDYGARRGTARALALLWADEQH